MTILNGNGPAQPTPDNVYGLITVEGVVVVRGSHTCGAPGCTRPATVAVFGTYHSENTLARFNVCQWHIQVASREVNGPWFCALVWDRDVYGEACPHCGIPASQIDPRGGYGHVNVCPVGLAFPDFAYQQGVRRTPHDVGDCDVCGSYLNRRPGPTG